MNWYPYQTAWWVSVIYVRWEIKIVTKNEIDVWSWVIYLPKSLIQFILNQQLSSPLKASILLTEEEIGFTIDAIWYSPDEKTGFIACKNLYYITK